MRTAVGLERPSPAKVHRRGPKRKRGRTRGRRFRPPKVLTSSNFGLIPNVAVKQVVELLRTHAIQPSAQRVAVANYVLVTKEHPTAEQVFHAVTATFPTLSRATVYNTLHLFVKKGLLKQFALSEGVSVFDPHVEPHHHFVDDETGAIVDIPWDRIRVEGADELPGIDVRDFQVVVRGTRARRRTTNKTT